jgi:hypothetical protein
MTPEGRVKANVKKVVQSWLTKHPQLIYIYMPVPGGFGAPSLDFIGCAAGHFFAIETKAKGKKLTAQQVQTSALMRAAGGRVFEIIGDDGLEELGRWLEKVLSDGSSVPKTQSGGDPL